MCITLDKIPITGTVLAINTRHFELNSDGANFDTRNSLCTSQLFEGECERLRPQNNETFRSTVIPRLTKIIRSGMTFVSRNTYTDGKDKLLEWPDRSCLLLYVSAHIH